MLGNTNPSSVGRTQSGPGEVAEPHRLKSVLPAGSLASGSGDGAGHGMADRQSLGNLKLQLAVRLPEG